MAKAHVMTPKRRAALKKAQAVSARKRRGKGKGKLAAANRKISRQRKVALVAATGGLALAAAGVAGRAYIRKTAGGGPKSKKLNHGTKKSKVSGHTSVAPMMTRHNALRAVTGARWGDIPASRRTLLPIQGPARPPQPASRRVGGPPKSTSAKVNVLRITFGARRSAESAARRGAESRNHPLVSMSRHRMADRANRKRGLNGYIPSKAKFDRRRSKTDRKKYPRI